MKTGSDGILVLLKLFLMIRSYKPLTFFGALGIVLFLGSLLASISPLVELAFEHHLRSFPKAFLATALLILFGLQHRPGIGA